MKKNKMLKPDYEGGSIVNLMASLQNAMGKDVSPYVPLRQLAPENVKRARNVVLMVIDALGYNYVRTTGKGGCFDTHLQGKMTTVYLSTTTAAISTYLTGLAPQQHALMGWNTWLKELGAVVQILPFCTRGGRLSLEHSSIDLATLYNTQPFVDKLQRPSTFVSPDMIIDSAYNRAQSSHSHKVPHHNMRSFFAETANAVKANKKSQYIYSYWPTLDTLGHIHGIHSAHTEEHFHQLDQGFAAFLDDIKGTDTVVIVSGDHGMIDATPQSSLHLSDYPHLNDMLNIPLCGEPRAPFCYIKASRAKAFEEYVRSELADVAELMPSEQLIEENYLGLGQTNPRLLERVGDYTLMMKDNYALYDQLFQERRHRHIGVHGGLSEDEMLVPLVVAEV